MAATVNADLKELLANALTPALITAASATLYLKVIYTEDVGGKVKTNTVSYDTAAVLNGTNYEIDISADSTFTFTYATDPFVVNRVELWEGTTILATETLTTDNNFPNGGDLIVTSFKVTVS